MRIKYGRFSLPLLLLGGVLLLRAGTSLAGASGKILVSATIVPLGDFCRQIGGERVDVQVLIPPGASPHAFEPPPSTMARAARSRLFVYIGAGLEPWAEKLLRSRSTPDLAVVEAARGLPLLQEAGDHGHREAEAGRSSHATLAGNPHIWLDPVLAQDICHAIADALIRLDPENRAFYEARLQAYLGQLVALDREIRERIKTWRLKEYVSFHPAFTYFARRYGLKEAGVLEVAPGREPTPRHLREIVAAIRALGLRVVFAEPQLNPRVAQVVAQEAQVQVLMLDPVGGRLPYGDDYLKLMRYNLATLEQAMQ